MSSPVCSECDDWIDSGNRAFPGYCSVNCKQKAHEQRDRGAAALAQSRTDRRQHAEAQQPAQHYYT